MEKVVYRLSDLMEHLEALEMLDMTYTIQKVVHYKNPYSGNTHEVAYVINYKIEHKET